ncbi:hypothetical protein [Agromyces sp. LHK192]|uniref:hypothetical protein n=1 Tax=Agromyces sp. LHK192 TaxID=2498704 RepID=UPI0013E3597C|nr:hypothetical protein [Agromyces sp. LHK192]
MDASEARLRALQRRAYGADPTDEERARAVDEIAELEARGSIRAERPGTTTADQAAGPVGPSDAPNGRADIPRGMTDPALVRLAIVRWASAAGGVGLLLGAILGWGAAQRTAPGSDIPSTAAPSIEGSPDAGVPLGDTELFTLIEQLPPAAESARVASVDETIDLASVRLLASRLEGPAAYVARTIDGEDVCLVLLLPTDSARSECTEDGRLPADGLRVLYGTQENLPAVGRLDSAGVVSIGLVVAS